MVVASRLLPYARPEGLVSAFLPGTDGKETDGKETDGKETDGAAQSDADWSLVAGVIGAAAALGLATAVAGRRGAAAVIAGSGAAAVVLESARRRLGGYTGDVLGAAGVTCEIFRVGSGGWRGSWVTRAGQPARGGRPRRPRPVPIVGDTTSAADRAANPRSWRFSDRERRAFYAIVRGRHDIRRFRPDPLEPDLVERVLSAAHAGPSVGHSQPWRFLLVTQAETRERAAIMAERERQRQANLLAEEARRRMLDLRVGRDPGGADGGRRLLRQTSGAGGRTRAGHLPGRDLWSCACAIENLWLAARAEGLGLGWVTLFPPDELASLVGLPTGVETLGWLCLGWPDELPPNPGLERAGWSRRAPLDTVVLHERWDAATKPPAASQLRAPDQAAVVGARDQADTLLTPPGSLGVLDRALDRLGRTGDRHRRPGQSGAGGRRPPGHPVWRVDIPLHGDASGNVGAPWPR